MRDSEITVVEVYPDLLGTYGDAGNAFVLFKRLEIRGIRARLLRVESREPLPRRAHLYTLGGGEDAAQVLACRLLKQEGALSEAVDEGAAILAVCAGFQILGRSFEAGDAASEGLCLVDCETRRLLKRAVGEVVTTTREGWVLSGFENHMGKTVLGQEAAPLGHVVYGVGNGDGRGSEGARQGRIVCTYMHGPFLARNPEVADLLLGFFVPNLEPLPKLDGLARQLKASRLKAVGGGLRAFLGKARSQRSLS